jgi:hypothetical protein
MELPSILKRRILMKLATLNKKFLLDKRIKTLHDVMPDSEIPKFFEEATGRKYTSKELCVNDIRRIIMLYWNIKIANL